MRVRWLIFALIAALVAAFFYKLTFTHLILARGDTFAYFYPYWDARDAALAAGTLPLWSPDLFMGVPLLANSQIGTFYPPNWLTISLAAPDAIRVSILLHVLWAAVGAFWLARRSLGLARLPALITSVIFAFGGYLGTHVEQINQLQGLAWMPFLFLLLDAAFKRPVRYVPLLGVAWALQLLTGHTQTVFISGVGLGIYALIALDWNQYALKTMLHSISIRLLGLALAVVIAVVIALPQLVPTQELISVSNRGDGLNRQEATAFSLDPTIVGRGMLPSYAGQPFGEYIGYIGVIGLGLMLCGVFSTDKRRWAWLIIALVGVFFAFGRFNPLYYEVLAQLPGFNLFRVPARWLALFALAGAMLAGLGADSVLQGRVKRRPALIASAIGVAGLIGLAFLAQSGPERITEPAQPTVLTLLLWAGAFVVFVAVTLWRRSALLLAVVVLELWLASHTLPYNDLTDPAVYRSPRFPVSLLRAYGSDGQPAGRLLSISRNQFDPGDKPVLAARWQGYGLGAIAIDHAFTAIKLNEIIAPNLPLTWGIPTIDGFDGGVLPTLAYSAFAELLLPQGAPRTVDGRLRENLALPDCRGACLPDARWLNLTDTRFLLLDKVYDLVHEGIFFDTALRTPLNTEAANFPNRTDFLADGLHILYACTSQNTCSAPIATFDDVTLTPIADAVTVDAFTLARYTSEQMFLPAAVTLNGTNADIIAVTLVNSRTGDFAQLTPEMWRRIYSAEVKIYENQLALPRALVFTGGMMLSDDLWQGTEQALSYLRDESFNPADSVIIHNQVNSDVISFGASAPAMPAQITAYTPTRVSIEASTAVDGAYLLFTDAYYPGWQATVNGVEVDVLRANVMFRAVRLERGNNEVVFSYSLGYLPSLMLFAWGVFPVCIVLLTWILARRRR